ncbi:sugar ABC transporter ATP-binding protein [Nocardioides campestrisoli]|uniref:sugar ABC transporter ATP-binding protein n=1 Tax=Nocardioides campestrisoli TaxID=2736757 RepID=UPI00163DB176|nr:sugar ABC transporter ATP-binding protein [Nocardioides campestrisoli]
MSAAQQESPVAAEPVLRMTGITKTYAGNIAVDAVDFDVRPGEVHALLGENGAGKSTLCKIISGAAVPDSGEMQLAGETVRFTHPSEALAAGISMVYQETSLIPTMSVAQNLELGDEPLVARMRRINISARQHLQSLNFHVPVTKTVSSLGGAHRQMVEIVRSLRKEARLVIFDEPTATLTPEEKEQLFGAIERLRERGIGIVYVSHAIEESLQIADRITVLRDGQLQKTVSAKDTTRREIVAAMVGRSVEYTVRRGGVRQAAERRKVLSVENLNMGAVVKNMSFSAYSGEVLGIAGLVGAGRTETARIIAGAAKRSRINGGRIYLNGRPVRYSVPRQAAKDGVVYITEDRKVNGFFETMSVEQNIFLGHLATAKRMPLWARPADRRSVAKKFVERFAIRSVSGKAKVIELSGGNQQKVVLAKALTRAPQVVIFDEPTRGVDVGAIEEIHQIIREFADSGAAVILLSSYLPEILALSDRVLVARQGSIAAEFAPETVTEERIMFAAVH